MGELINNLSNPVWWISTIVAGYIISLIANSTYDWYKTKIKPFNEESKKAFDKELNEKAEFLRKSPSDYYEFRLNRIELQLNHVFNSIYLLFSFSIIYVFQSAPKLFFVVLIINLIISFTNWMMIRDVIIQKKKLQKRYDEIDDRGDMPRF